MTDQPDELVEHFFRHESAKLVALLTHAFGFELVDVVEDMVQESMLQALASWRLGGVPENPTAWLHRVARNRIIDVLRRNQKVSPGDPVEIELPGSRTLSFESDEIQDSVLRMIFTCCHPSLDRPSQLALTLRMVCGLGTAEIARGLLAAEEATKKRITRAKQTLQLNRIQFELPPPAVLVERLDAVHDVLYLMFNEGYSASRGEVAVRIDLCEEAARLCHLLCESDNSTPTTRALLSLMLFHAARMESRLSDEGAVVLLSDQDRSQWDRNMITVAQYWLTRSAEGDEISRYHLEAGIARMHCQAKSIDDTNWEGVLKIYDMLIKISSSPVYRLNRAVALALVGRSDEGLSEVNELMTLPQFKSYPLVDCVAADLLIRNGRSTEAVPHLEKALRAVRTTHEKNLIRERLESLSGLS